MPEAADERKCPDCERTFTGPQAALNLGAHRRGAHGTVGATHGRDKGRKRDRAPRATTAKPRQPSLAKDLRSTFKVLGTVVSIADPYCGKVLIDRSGPTADALARLAAEDPRVARWLRVLGKSGPYGALLIAAGEMAVPIAAHHGLLAPEMALLVGAPPPPYRGPEKAAHLSEAEAEAMLGAILTDPNGHEATEDVAERAEPGA